MPPFPVRVMSWPVITKEVHKVLSFLVVLFRSMSPLMVLQKFLRFVVKKMRLKKRREEWEKRRAEQYPDFEVEDAHLPNWYKCRAIGPYDFVRIFQHHMKRVIYHEAPHIFNVAMLGHSITPTMNCTWEFKTSMTYEEVSKLFMEYEEVIRGDFHEVYESLKPSYEYDGLRDNPHIYNRHICRKR